MPDTQRFAWHMLNSQQVLAINGETNKNNKYTRY